jgi:hypothetical protein
MYAKGERATGSNHSCNNAEYYQSAGVGDEGDPYPHVFFFGRALSNTSDRLACLATLMGAVQLTKNTHQGTKSTMIQSTARTQHAAVVGGVTLTYIDTS